MSKKRNRDYTLETIVVLGGALLSLIQIFATTQRIAEELEDDDNSENPPSRG